MEIVKQLKSKLIGYKRVFKWITRQATTRNRFGFFGQHAVYEIPGNIECPEDVYIHDYARLRNNCKILNAPGSKVIIKKYAVVASGCTFITDGHVNTVGIPQFFLGQSHIHDKSGDITVQEDAWIGANCTIMPNVTIGRGALVGTGALVTKDVPPYALVVGVPAKIVGKIFELEDVIKHEKSLYMESERLPLSYLTTLYDQYYIDKKTFGTNKPLNDEEKALLNRIKRAYNAPAAFSEIS